MLLVVDANTSIVPIYTCLQSVCAHRSVNMTYARILTLGEKWGPITKGIEKKGGVPEVLARVVKR